jgi:3-deoxy-D-manno-octulosonic-acid transferase
MKEQPHSPEASGSPPELPAELRSWLRKNRRQSLLLTLLEPFWMLIHRRRQWRRILTLWGLYARRPPQEHVWIHAVGPGQMRVAIALVAALPPEVPVVITSYPPGQQLARRALGDRVALTWLPLFFRFAVRGFLRRYAPRHLVLIEATDLRPLLCLHTVRQELSTALVNGWFDERWLEEDPFLRLLDRIQIFGVRADKDRELLAGTGIPRDRVFLTGDMKLDAMTEPLPELEAQIQDLAGGRPILIAGSTHLPDVPPLLDAFVRLGGGDRALLVIAPREPPMFEATEKLLRERGIEVVRRSRFPVAGRPAAVLLDTEGELASLYRLAAAVFIGNSLAPTGGGHNPIEPARFAVPIAVGPQMANFRLLADLFDRAGAWQRVADAAELARVWGAWLEAPEIARQTGQRAAELVESQRGHAISETLALLRPFLGLDDNTATLPATALAAEHGGKS